MLNLDAGGGKETQMERFNQERMGEQSSEGDCFIYGIFFQCELDHLKTFNFKHPVQGHHLSQCPKYSQLGISCLKIESLYFTKMRAPVGGGSCLSPPASLLFSSLSLWGVLVCCVVFALTACLFLFSFYFLFLFN